jgi:hypothetical protein
MQSLAQRGYTADEVLDALRGRHGARELTFRYSLLDADNEYLGELSNVESCSISQAALADIVRTAKFSLLDDGTINYLSNRIQPWVRLSMPGLRPGEPATYDQVLSAAVGEPLMRYKLDEPIPTYREAVSALQGGAGPLLWYRLDEAVGFGIATNYGSVGPGADGVVSRPSGMPGAAGLVAPGTAYNFVTASNDVVTINDTGLVGKAALTVAGWVKANAVGNGTIVSFATAATGGTIRVELMFIATGGVSAAANCIRAAVRVGASTVASETLANTQTTSTMHVAMTWVSGEAPKIYVNGALMPVTSNAPLSGTVTAYTHTLIGSRGGSLTFNGIIDSPLAHDQALSAAQILALYRAGVGQTLAINAGSSGAAQDGIPTGTGMPGQFGLVQGGSSYRLNPANNNSIRIPGGGTLLDNADRFTVGFWFRVNDLAANDFFVDNTNTAGQDDGLSVWKHTSNLLVIRVKLSTGIMWMTTQAGSIGRDTTYHMVVTWQTGLPMRLWLNGEEQTLTVQGISQPLNAIGLVDMVNADLYLGKWQFDNTVGAATLLNGMLDDVLITKAYVDENDVLQMYNAGIRSGKYAGENYVEWPQGVFLLSSPERASDEADVVRRAVDAYDGLQVLADDLATERFTATQGDKYTDVISGILGTMVKSITPSTLTLPVDAEWEPGTSKLVIANDLCSAINYERVFFDENGTAIVRPYVAPADRAPEFTYRDDELSVILPSAVQQRDLFQIPNKWVLVVSEPDRPALKAELTNSDPNSQTSTVARGRTITDFRTEQDAPDQATLEDKTRRLALEASQVFETVQFETLLMPIHSHNDVFDLAYGVLQIDGKYAETGWDMPLQAGATMKHTIRRTISVELEA